MPKCRINSFFLRVEYFIKKVSKYWIYLTSWGTRCWMTSYATKGWHFLVITTGNGEPKKFLVGLRFLSYPPFVRLLEAAEREFGFEQGVLAIHCVPSELQQVILHV